MKKAIVYVVGVVVALVIIIYRLKSIQHENTERTNLVKESSSGAVPVLVSRVMRTAFDNTFTANGNFEAVNQIELAADVAGRITHLNVREGSVVKAGDVIAVVDNEVFRADLQAEKARIDQAKQDLERYEKALATGGVTQKQVDDMRLQVETSQSKYIQAQRKLNDAQIKAPVSGVINQRFVELGSYLAPGSKVVEIVDISRLKLAVTISESQVVQLKTGDRVNVTTTVFPETYYAGTITFIAPKGDATLNYPVEIEIVNVKGKELKAGMYGTAHFNLPEQTPLMLIPRSAFTSGVNSNHVYLLHDGKAHGQKVVAARLFGDQVEVREGLHEGDSLITSGQINLTEGTPVVVQR